MYGFNEECLLIFSAVDKCLAFDVLNNVAISEIWKCHAKACNKVCFSCFAFEGKDVELLELHNFTRVKFGHPCWISFGFWAVCISIRSTSKERCLTSSQLLEVTDSFVFYSDSSPAKQLGMNRTWSHRKEQSFFPFLCSVCICFFWLS